MTRLPTRLGLGLVALALAVLVGCSTAAPQAHRVGAGEVGPQRDAEERALERALEALEVVDGRLRPRAVARDLPDLAARTPDELDQLRRGHLRAGRTAEAVAVLAASLSRRPEIVDTYALLARALRQAGRLPLARAAVRGGLDRVTGDQLRLTARLTFELGAIEAAEGPSENALHLWRRVLDLDPDHGESHLRLAVALAQRGRPSEARLHANRARRLGAPPPAALGPMLRGDGLPVTLLAAGTNATGPSVGPPVRVDSGLPGEPTVEPVLAASPEGELVAAWVEQIDREGTRMSAARSLDRGATWIPLGPLGPPDPESPALTLNADPDIVYHPGTDRFWMTGTSFSAARLGGIFWIGMDAGTGALEDSEDLREPGALSDFAMLDVGPGVGGEGTAIYVADLKGFQRSTDLGATWSDVLSYPDDFQLLGTRVEVAPSGDVVTVVGLTSEGRYLAVRSPDGGETFEAPITVADRLDPWLPQDTARFPGTFRAPPVGTLAMDPRDGTLYLTYFDTARIVETADGPQSDVDLFLTRSSDSGTTWNGAPADPHRWRRRR